MIADAWKPTTRMFAIHAAKVRASWDAHETARKEPITKRGQLVR